MSRFLFYMFQLAQCSPKILNEKLMSSINIEDDPIIHLQRDTFPDVQVRTTGKTRFFKKKFKELLPITNYITDYIHTKVIVCPLNLFFYIL